MGIADSGRFEGGEGERKFYTNFSISCSAEYSQIGTSCAP